MNNYKKNRIERDPERKLLGGVLSGLGAHANVNPNILRAGWVGMTIFFTTASVITYLILYFAMNPHRR